MSESRFSLKHVQKAFGASAPFYDQHAELQKDIRDSCLELAKTQWPIGSAILDLGTGTGAMAHTAQNEVLGWEVTGVDITFNMCAQARSYNTYVVNANAEAIPFADASFDGIFSCLMMQWSNSPLQLFKEMLRVIKPGGSCILSSFIHGTLSELRETFATLNTAIHVNDFGPPNYFSALAVHAGFRVLSSEEDIVTEYYPDMISIMRGLKAIGASTKQQGERQKGLMTPRQLKLLERYYRQNYASEEGFPATWQVMTLLLEKPVA